MYITDILGHKKPAFSFEFFPPKTQLASDQLLQNIKELIPLRPLYVSVTYGASGTDSKSLTHQLVLKLKQETGLTIIPHLTCVGSNFQEIHTILRQYEEIGIQNIMALRGDLPKAPSEGKKVFTDFKYAIDLVKFIKKNFPSMQVGVAGFPEGHPDTPNRILEIDYLKAKVDAGASYICTQLFFDNHHYYDFCERLKLAKINIPVVAGIMPITSQANLKRISQIALCTNIPAALLKSIAFANANEGIEQIGTHWAAEQVRDLINHNCPGIHFYTLNQSKSTLNICRSLGLKEFP